MNPIRRFYHLSEGALPMKFVFALVLTTIIMTLGVTAQQVTLTLDQAVSLALDKNSDVIQAKNTAQGEQSTVQSAYGGLLPTVDASGSYGHTTKWVAPVPGVGSEEYSAGISGKLVLFNGFANTSNISRANANANSAEYSLNRTEQSTVYQTHQLFLNVVRNYQLLKVNEDNVKRSKRQLERITESNKVGAVALADVYRQQVQVGSDELSLIQAQNSYENSKADLIAYLGVNFDKEYVFDFTGIPTNIDTAEFVVVNSQYSNFNDLVKSAVEKRPDHQSMIENLNSAEASVTIAQGEHYPTVSANLDYGYSNNVFSRLTDNKKLDFGVTVSVPIFRGFSTQTQIEQAQVQKRNAEERLMQSKRQISVDVRKALLNLEAAEKQVQVTSTSVASAEEDRKIAEEKYNLGAGTLLDLLIANANYSTAQSNKVNAVNNYLLAKKQTEYSLGMISK